MKILIGSCTKHDAKEFEKTPMYTSLLKQLQTEYTETTALYTGAMDVAIKLKNTENIGKHYNKVLKMGVDENYDCVVLMHDDVQVDDCNWTYKVEEAFREYDVVGLAGARHISIKEPALWHLMADPGHWRGTVAHPHNEEQLLVTSFGPTPARCLVLDGLFLAIKVDSLRDKPDVKFDENIPAIAHHYDIDFCLQANKHKLKLTTYPIWAIHKSCGLENQSEEFLQSQKYFLDKWQN